MMRRCCEEQQNTKPRATGLRPRDICRYMTRSSSQTRLLMAQLMQLIVQTNGMRKFGL